MRNLGQLDGSAWATVAGQLVAGTLDGKLVVLGELVTSQDAAQGKDDSVLLFILKHILVDI